MDTDVIPEMLYQLYHQGGESSVILEQIQGIFGQYLVMYLLSNARLVIKLFAVRSLLVGDGHQRENLQFDRSRHDQSSTHEVFFADRSEGRHLLPSLLHRWCCYLVSWIEVMR